MIIIITSIGLASQQPEGFLNMAAFNYSCAPSIPIGFNTEITLKKSFIIRYGANSKFEQTVPNTIGNKYNDTLEQDKG